LSLLLVKLEKLHFKDEKSDKVYEVELFHIQDDEYIVNFKYGRRGRRLNEGTKTVFPVPKEKADKVFQDLVTSKVNKGYIIVQEYSEIPKTITKGKNDQKNAAVSVILKYLKDRVDSSPHQPNWKLSRIIWRAGELKIQEAIPLVHELMPWLTGQEVYAAIWMMGRMASAQSLNYLQSYNVVYSDLHYNIHIAALLKSGDRSREKAIVDVLPLELKTSYENNDFDKFEQVAYSYLFELNISESNFLLNSYFLSINKYELRQPLLRLLGELQLVPKKWKFVRSIYKIAEMIDDGDTLGVLAKRINSEASYYNTSYGNIAYINGERLNITEESRSSNAKLAFSKKTKRYFIRRTLKHLMQMGQDRQESYCILASGILKSYNENDYIEHKPENVYTYNRETRNYSSQLKTYPKLAHIPFVYYIIYNNGERLKGHKTSRFYFEGEATDQIAREDTYPSLWNKYPKHVVGLLSNCGLKEVMNFCFLILNDCKNIDQYFTMDVLKNMLTHPFVEIVEYSLSFISKQYNSKEPDIDTVTLLIESGNENALRLGLKLIDLNRTPFLTNKEFILNILVIENLEIQEWVRNNIIAKDLLESDVKEIVDYIFDHYYQLNENEFKSESAKSFIVVFEEYLRHLNPKELVYMIDHPLIQIQLFGAKLININNADVSDWPDDLLLKMLSSEHDQIRNEGIQLFSKLTDQELLQKDKYISKLASSEFRDLRLKAREIVGRLAPIGKTFSEKIFAQLFDVLMEKHEYDELPLDVHETIQLHLKEYAFRSMFNNTDAFLNSNIREIQLIASEYIKNNQTVIEQWPVEYWALMGKHGSKSIRIKAHDLFESHIDKVKFDAHNAVKILDTNWDETFNFAAKYFEAHFNNNTWTPELIISLCDSTIIRVQDYGTGILGRFFEEQNGVKYLEALSDHPDSVIQLYCTNYLDRFAFNNDDVLSKLKPYFIRVLSSINSRRTAKLRVFSFLEKQSKTGGEKAKYVALILNEVVGTIAKTENEKYVGLLYELEKNNSSMKSKLEILPLEIRS